METKYYFIERQESFYYPIIMLINCPRCGFSQPKDKYCAQCGVDMETFKPREVPLFKRLITHPASFVIVIFLSLLLGYKLTISLSSSLAGSNSSTLHSFLRSHASEDEDLTTYKEALTPSEEDADTEASDSEPNTSITTQAVAGANADRESLGKGSSGSIEKELVVTFYETKMVPFADWADHQGISDRFSHSEEYSIATIPKFTNLKKSFLQFSTPLDHLDKTVTLSQSVKVDFFYGFSSSQFQNERAGHRIYLAFNPLGPNSSRIEGQLYLQRFWYFKSNGRSFKEGSWGPSQQDSINEPLLLEKDSALMIVGTMPRETPLSVESKLIEKPLYQILKSEDFQKKLTDLIILIEVRDSNIEKRVDSEREM